jgi:hypothetical protein
MLKKLGREFLGFLATALLLGLVCDSATAQNAPKLKYGFQKGRQYAYDVKIFAQLPDEEVTHQGTLTYTVLSATSDQFALKCLGGLGKSVKPTGESTSGFGPGPGFGGPPRIPRPPHFGGPPGFGPMSEPRRPEGTTFNRQGGIVIFGNPTSLPLLLGNQANFVIEALPTDGKSNWDKQTDIGVIERSESDNFFRPFGPTSETSRGAKEQIDYAILETKGDSIRISKNYSIKTAAEESGKSHIDMTGSGEFEFDAKEGVIKSQSMKYDIQINEKNVVVTIPVTVSYNLISDALLAERTKKAEEAAAAVVEANTPKALQAGEREKLLKELRSGDEKRIDAAAKRLAKSIADDKPADLSKALCVAYKKTNPWIQKNVLDALAIWHTPDAEKTVIEACASTTFFVRDAAIVMLGNFKTATAAKAAAKYYNANRREAAAAFKTMGSFAEPYVLPFLKNEEFWSRKETCDLLAVIGGKMSLVMLKSMKATIPRDQLTYLNHAIEEIEKREGADESDSPPEAEAANEHAVPDVEELKKLGEELREAMQSGDASRIKAVQDRLQDAMQGKPAAKPAETKTPKGSAPSKLHTWHDATGTFEVEAEFVKAEADKVTIKRTDGKIITLPIKKLSKDDQEYVEQQKNKPENPFE